MFILIALNIPDDDFQIQNWRQKPVSDIVSELNERCNPSLDTSSFVRIPVYHG